jgi:hypothetical protein
MLSLQEARSLIVHLRTSFRATEEHEFVQVELRRRIGCPERLVLAA